MEGIGSEYLAAASVAPLTASTVGAGTTAGTTVLDTAVPLLPRRSTRRR